MHALAESIGPNAPYEIRRQDDIAHIAASKTSATTGYVIFKAKTVLGGSEVIFVSQPCVITTCRSATDLVLSIADPDLSFVNHDKAPNQWGYSQPSTIAITLHGRWKPDANSTAIVTYRGPGNTEITVRCKDGLTSSVRLTPISM